MLNGSTTRLLFIPIAQVKSITGETSNPRVALTNACDNVETPRFRWPCCSQLRTGASLLDGLH